jgi:hypothetical protein
MRQPERISEGSQLFKRLMSAFFEDGAEAVPDKSRSAPRAQPVTVAPMRVVGQFSAVSIVTTSACCDAGQQLAGKTFLLAQAPRLPLAECTRPDECRCRFQKHADRRGADPERRVMQSMWHTNAWDDGGERRKKRGRRKSDD